MIRGWQPAPPACWIEGLTAEGKAISPPSWGGIGRGTLPRDANTKSYLTNATHCRLHSDSTSKRLVMLCLLCSRDNYERDEFENMSLNLTNLIRVAALKIVVCLMAI